MGRLKKIVDFDSNLFESMSISDMLDICDKYQQLSAYMLSRIPENILKSEAKGKAESIAESYYKDLGFEVYRSKVSGGYRVIGVLFYWQNYLNKITQQDFKFIERISTLMSREDLKELADSIRDKNGTPDLLLIKDGIISFVEVKCSYETVKSSTIHFFIKHSRKWGISILRVIK